MVNGELCRLIFCLHSEGFGDSVKVFVALIRQCEASMHCDWAVGSWNSPQQLSVMRYCHEPGICGSSQDFIVLRWSVHNLELEPFLPEVFDCPELHVESYLAQGVIGLFGCYNMKTRVGWP